MSENEKDPQRIAEALVDHLYSHDASGERAAGPTPATGRFLHWWGQFSAELPGDFCLPGGGHGWIEASSLEDAERLAQTLRSFVREKWPRHKEWAGAGWYRWMRQDLKQMTLQFHDAAPEGITPKRA